MVDAVEFLQNVQLACFAVVFTCMALANRTDRTLRLVWYAYLVFGAGATIDLMGEHLPRWLVDGANLETSAVAYGLITLAIATFVGHSLWTRWVSVVLVLGGLPFYLAWSGTDRGVVNSVGVLDLVMCVQSLCAAWIVSRSSERATRPPRVILCVFFVIFSLNALFRSLVVGVLHMMPEEFAPFSGPLSASVYIVAVSLLPLAIVWMMGARSREALHTESNLDPLTRLLNRRGFAEAAQREMARYTRTGQDLAVAIADLDHFKQLNDTYGHSCGDEVLRSIAALFREVLRQTDVVGRLGGEEFILLLPDIDDAETLSALERLRVQQESRTVRLPNGQEVHTMVSIGVTNTAGRVGMTLEDLQEEADHALYAAKRAGRNRTECFVAEEVDPIESVSDSGPDASAALLISS